MLAIRARRPVAAAPSRNRRFPPTPTAQSRRSSRDSFSTEDARDRLGEAEEVIAFAGVTPGMSVADIGAGEGYYTVRLARAVGATGRVLAQDIVPATRDRLGQRVQRDRLDNVAVRLGLPDDPKLPAAASTGSSWSTCITKSSSPMPSCGTCAPG